MVAHKVKKVFVSDKNNDDIEDIKEKYPEIIENIEIQSVNTIRDCESIFIE